MPKLTKRLVDALAPEDGKPEAFAWDSELRGFGVRAKASGVKTFIAQYKTRQGATRRFAFARYGAVTVEQARHQVLGILAEVSKGADPSQQKRRQRAAMTVEALCAEYIERAEKGQIQTRRRSAKSRSTIATDRGRITRHIVPLLGKLTVEDVTTQHVRAFVRDLTAGKKTAKNEPSGKLRGRTVVTGGGGTATRTTGLLGAIFTYAAAEGYRSDNPVRGVTLPAYQKRDTRLNAEQFAALGRALRHAESTGEPWQAVLAIRLLALTGARRGEIVSLLRADVDLAGSALRLSSSKTGKSIRPLGERAADIIRDATSREDAPYVFPASRLDEKPFGGLPGAWTRIVTPVLPDATAHTLRHSFASVADDLGYSEATIAALLGHTSGGVTRGYIHKTDRVLIAAATAVAEEIERAMGDA